MIDVNNDTRFAVDKSFFAGVAKKVLTGENKQKENLSVVFVSPSTMRRFNKSYRKKDKPTDVLSFEKGLPFQGEWAEVVVCPAVVKKGIRRPDAFQRELANLVIHGILHTLGYDHERTSAEAKKMFTKQAYYLSKVTQ